MMEPTQNVQLIQRIAGHSEVWPQFGSDRVPVEAWVPDFTHTIWLTNGTFLMAFQRRYSNWYDLHIGCLPDARGGSEGAVSQGLTWMAENTQARYVTGLIGEENSACLRLAQKVGMKELARFDGRVMVGKEI